MEICFDVLCVIMHKIVLLFSHFLSISIVKFGQKDGNSKAGWMETPYDNFHNFILIHSFMMSNILQLPAPVT